MSTRIDLHNSGFVRRIKHGNDDLTVVNAARVSFGKSKEAIDDSDPRLLNYLADNDHWTPFAHARRGYTLSVDNDAMLEWCLNYRRPGWVVNRQADDTFYVEGSLYNWLGRHLGEQWSPPVSRDTYGAIVAHLMRNGCEFSVKAFGRAGDADMNVVMPPDDEGDLAAETFHIRAPIFVLRQWMRSNVDVVYNEISRRYVDSTPTYFNPGSEGWRSRPDKSIKQGSGDKAIRMFSVDGMNAEIERSGQWVFAVDIPTCYTDWCETANLLYDQIIRAGVAPEIARIILPQSMYSEIWMTALSPAIDRILALRTNRGESNHAQKEIEEYARALEEVRHDT